MYKIHTFVPTITNNIMKLIGKGSFSKVYQLSPKQVLIKSICSSKRCMSENRVSTIFPKLDRVGDNEYLCEYYPRVTSLKNSLNTDQYEIYKDLVNVFKNILEINCSKFDSFYIVRQQFSKIKNKRFRNNLIDMIDNMANYGTDVTFEISPRNVAVKNGKLILLDVFFFATELIEVREQGLKIS